MQAAAWIACTSVAVVAARNRQIRPTPRMGDSFLRRHFYFCFQSRAQSLARVLGHLGDGLAAVGVIAFTLASLLLIELGLRWREQARQSSRALCLVLCCFALF